MKKSDYKIEFDAVKKNSLCFVIMRKGSLFSFTIFGYKIKFISEWVPISIEMPLEDARKALREIHEWIDGGGK